MVTEVVLIITANVPLFTVVDIESFVIVYFYEDSNFNGNCYSASDIQLCPAD